MERLTKKELTLLSTALQKYTQYLYEHGYLDDDWIVEQPSPILEFINKNYTR